MANANANAPESIASFIALSSVTLGERRMSSPSYVALCIGHTLLSNRKRFIGAKDFSHVCKSVQCCNAHCKNRKTALRAHHTRMSLRDMFNWAYGLARRPKPSRAHHVVVDTGDDTLVAIGTYAPALLFLNESMMDTTYALNVVSDEIPVIKAVGPRAYPEWSFDGSSRTFRKTNPVVVTDEMRDRAVLAAKKVEAISRVIYWINRLRSKTNTGLVFQAAIYTEKERQARSLKDADFDEHRAASAPYVVQYADDSGISLREAAEEILLQAKLDHEHLARTEKIRLALFKKIRLAKTPEEVEGVLDTFRKTGTV